MNKNLDLIISENLRKEIEQSGLKKSQIAESIGVSRATISQYLSGRAQPTLATFAKLCAVLDISADEILELKK